MALDIESGFESILNVVDQEVENLVILYGHSENHTWNALAFQVNQIIRRTEEITNLPTLSSGGTLDPGFFGENGHSQEVASPGKPETRISTNFTETIIEYGFAVEPDDVLVWVENPGGNKITGLQGKRTRYVDPAGGEAASVWSNWTKTKEGIPTTALSGNPWQGLVRVDTGDQGRNNIYIGFENKSETDAPLKVFALGMNYQLTQIKDEKKIKDMFFGRGINRRILTWGSIRNTNPNLPSDWKSGVNVTSEDVKKAVKGGPK